MTVDAPALSLSLTEFLSRRVAASDAAVALVYGERRVTYAALAEESRRVAQGLAGLGVGPGDRVAVWLPNVPAWLACFFACAQLGAILVTVNTRFKSGEVADIVGRSGARALVYWPDFRQIDFAGILRDIPPAALAHLTTIVAYDESPDAVVYPPLLGRPVIRYRDLASRPVLTAEGAAPDTGCIIFTTSGTTRAPKFVLHPQASLTRHASDMARVFGFDGADAMLLLTIPLCGVMGLCMATAAVAAGRPLVMLPTFEAKAAAQAIREHRITHLPAVGDIVAQLLATTTDAVPFPSLRLAVGARGGQAAPAQARGLTLMGTYGMSEVQAMLSAHPLDAPPEQRELGGGTLVAPEGRVRARDPATGEILAHGAHGELEFHVPSMMAEYYANPEANAAAFTADGYLKSGDLGYTTGDNSFIFLSRMGDVLRLAGFLVNPLEIEAVLDAHPTVRASQVVGIDGPRGTRAVAFVIAREGATVDAQALIAHCAQRIAKFKVPEHILPIDTFPFTPSANGNKVQKAKLREIADAALNRRTEA
jgi:fatty-acyl-CoA synthase